MPLFAQPKSGMPLGLKLPSSAMTSQGKGPLPIPTNLLKEIPYSAIPVAMG
jgi:hypothetical protein